MKVTANSTWDLFYTRRTSYKISLCDNCDISHILGTGSAQNNILYKMDELCDKVSHDSYWMDIRMYCTRADADKRARRYWHLYQKRYWHIKKRFEGIPFAWLDTCSTVRSQYNSSASESGIFPSIANRISRSRDHSKNIRHPASHPPRFIFHKYPGDNFSVGEIIFVTPLSVTHIIPNVTFNAIILAKKSRGREILLAMLGKFFMAWLLAVNLDVLV